ncbi:aquaporin [Streptomyces sp. NBC_01230]|uniref:MIP/aquaporin family protein n=1 Tax=unclassified Streptomyces TaxID=2593676 RepID=UPI002E10FE45|nr:aquaporin [Streptomyces sp. NBC_01230]
MSELAATALMLLAMTVLMRHLFHPDSWLHAHLPSDDARLLVDAVVSGAVVAALIASPLGRLSGAHMNPAVTVVLWVVRRLPGRDVPLYVSAQAVGSVLGTAAGRLLAGPSVAHRDVNYALLSVRHPAPDVWIMLGETIATAVLLAVVVRLARDPGLADVAPLTIGALLTVLIALTTNVTGGSLNPARQFGPWLMSGGDALLWPYVVGPLIAAVVVGATAAAVFGPVGKRTRL